MDSVSVNKFRDNIKSYVEQIVANHKQLKEMMRGNPEERTGKVCV